MFQEQFLEIKTIRGKKSHKEGQRTVDIRFEPRKSTGVVDPETLLAEIQQLSKSGTRKRRNKRS